MKSAELFWEVIRNYNQATLGLQLVLCILLGASVLLAYGFRLFFLPKLALALSSLFIAVVFFLLCDGSPVARFFGFPLFAALGLLFIYDALKNRAIEFLPFDFVSGLFFLATLLYPTVSLLLGHVYPSQVLYILPCPLVSLGLVLYSRYAKKSTLILAVMTVWALTGFKAFVFDALEDLILLSTSGYGIYLIAMQKRKA